MTHCFMMAEAVHDFRGQQDLLLKERNWDDGVTGISTKGREDPGEPPRLLPELLRGSRHVKLPRAGRSTDDCPVRELSYSSHKANVGE